MKISKRDATEIVNELSGLIGLKMNIFDSNAIIIASSDSNRVGDFHEAAYQIITQNLDELVVYNNQQYKGTISGTNLPLIIDGKIIGVVGITGPHEIARNYGKVIQRMTEILLQSRAEENRKMQHRQAFEHYCASWICNSQTVLNDEFISQGRGFGLDITQLRRIMIVSAPNGDNEALYTSVRKFLSSKEEDDHAFLAPRGVVLILTPRSNQKLEALAQELLHLPNREEQEVYVGIDTPGKNMWDIRQQHDRAQMALSAGFRLKKRVVFYEDLCLELILDEISVCSKMRYLKKIFGSSSREEIQRDMHTVKVLYEENGSIRQAAKRLIIHPNTLQYQLKRIEEKTGYDPRKLQDAGIFSIAALFLSEQSDLLDSDM